MHVKVKRLVGAIGVAALSVAPVALLGTSVSFLAADAAFAKGKDNGKGGGGGGGKSSSKGGGKGAGKGGEKSASRSGGGKAGAQRGGSGGLGATLERMIRGDKAKTSRKAAPGAEKPRKTQAAKPNGQAKRIERVATRNAPETSSAPPGRGKAALKGTGMHPSELGNMNGALNANINAVLAHVRNGNTNGPVGLLAALAVADVNAGLAEEFLATAEAQEYLGLRDGLSDALSANGFPDVEAYEAYLAEDIDGDGVADNAPIEEIDTAIADLGAFETDNPDLVADVDAADGELDALAGAEQALLDYWNKNPDSDPETLTGEEQQLLDALYSRLDGYDEEIAAALDDPAEDSEEGDGDGSEIVEEIEEIPGEPEEPVEEVLLPVEDEQATNG